eukprot:764936-Hanusia_phi.AAC.2
MAGSQKRDVLMLDLDPSLHRTMLTSFCGVDESSHGDGETRTQDRIGSNIFPVYADPESELAWRRYRLRSASLVVCCTIDRDPKPLCEFMRASKAILMVVTNSNEEAKVLYDLGVSYAIQQEYLAALEVGIMLKDEYTADSQAERLTSSCTSLDMSLTHVFSLFAKRRTVHLEELKEEHDSYVRRRIGEFI